METVSKIAPDLTCISYAEREEEILTGLPILAITFSRAYTKAGSNQIIYEGRTWTKFEFKVDPRYGLPYLNC